MRPGQHDAPDIPPLQHHAPVPRETALEADH
ncbi:MAG: hypothetical protein H6Q78_1773 [Candidatus Krumholzibacteriota bacterium]|nr:hypothetical protein [Candidatus Krumholzibacteriota bacterium]